MDKALLVQGEIDGFNSMMQALDSHLMSLANPQEVESPLY